MISDSRMTMLSGAMGAAIDRAVRSLDAVSNHARSAMGTGRREGMNRTFKTIEGQGAAFANGDLHGPAVGVSAN